MNPIHPRTSGVRDRVRQLASRYQIGRHVRFALLSVSDVADRVRGRQDPGVPPKAARDFVGGGDFRQIGQEFLGHTRELAGLKPSDRVLEIGSGIGRIALPLTDYLDGGSYDGLEIVRRGVRWCRRNITSRHPRFRFHHADIENGTYNRTGRIRAEHYRFPFDAETFDVALLTSVFTHLLPRTVENYIAELARVLAPGGRLLCTFYLLNDESEALLRAGRSTISFSHEIEGARVHDAYVPENAVAFREHDVRAMLDRHEFTVEEPINYGTWCQRRAGVSVQDIVIATRR